MRMRPAQHLRRPSEIQAVRRQGSRFGCAAFTLWWRPRADAPGPSRACFVASGQAVGKAVQRNRAKRRMREVFRRNQHLLAAPCDLMMVARQPVNRWPFERLERAFAEASAKIRSGAAPGNP